MSSLQAVQTYLRPYAVMAKWITTMAMVKRVTGQEVMLEPTKKGMCNKQGQPEGICL